LPAPLDSCFYLGLCLLLNRPRLFQGYDPGPGLVTRDRGLSRWRPYTRFWGRSGPAPRCRLSRM